MLYWNENQRLQQNWVTGVIQYSAKSYYANCFGMWKQIITYIDIHK